VGRTFQNTVILLLNDAIGGAFGLIANSPLSERSIPTRFNSSNANHEGEEQQQEQSIVWRRGGPVCGGRLGVVNYAILHTYPPTWYLGQDGVLDVDIDEEYIEEENEHHAPVVMTDEDNDEVPSVDDFPAYDAETASAEDDDFITPLSDPETDDDDVTPAALEHEICAPLSLPIFDVARNNPPLQFVAAPETQDPATFSEDSLSRIIPRLVNTHPPPESDEATNDDAATLDTDNNSDAGDTGRTESGDASTANGGRKIFVFMGYCKWRAGQLQREIQREVWDVCVDATPADILRHHNDDNFW
jgi:putative AlgH/UPF0301 family transcriptional regulator